MRNLTETEKEIVAAHLKWLRGEEDGKRANLSEANLSEANLSEANLSEANLSEANLREADLSGADLSGANLSGADLSGANLREADLSGANLRGANLSEANLREADLSGANLKYEDIPVIPTLHAKIAEAVSNGVGKLEMKTWHTCETTHCRAGWAITLAGDAGRELEKVCGSALAGALLYHRAYPDERIPNFYAANGAAMKDILACAEREKSQQS